MITRRDNLLLRPWQERRYDHHRRKVQSASPAIDNTPPAPRYHVMLKLKKKQKESERCKEIEKNNFILLQKMGHIMRTNRVDNTWTSPQPNFLNRISMYEMTVPKMEDRYEVDAAPEDKGHQSRKMKCLACTPKLAQELKIPEERVPWEPPKSPVSRRRSKSVPVRQREDFFLPPPPSSANTQPKKMKRPTTTAAAAFKAKKTAPLGDQPAAEYRPVKGLFEARRQFSIGHFRQNPRRPPRESPSAWPVPLQESVLSCRLI